MTTQDTIKVEGLFTSADAMAEVRKARRGRVVTFYARMCADLPTVDVISKEPTGRVFPGAMYAHIELSRPAAVKLVERLADNMAGLEHRGGRLPMSIEHSDWGAHFGKARYRTRIIIG